MLIEFLKSVFLVALGLIAGWVWGNVRGYKTASDEWKEFIKTCYLPKEGAEQDD